LFERDTALVMKEKNEKTDGFLTTNDVLELMSHEKAYYINIANSSAAIYWENQIISISRNIHDQQIDQVLQGRPINSYLKNTLSDFFTFAAAYTIILRVRRGMIALYTDYETDFSTLNLDSLHFAVEWCLQKNKN